MTLEGPAPRERIFNIPAVVVTLCGVLLVIQGASALITPEAFNQVLIRFAFVPGRFTFAFDPDRVSAAFNQIAGGDELRAQVAAAFLGDGTAQWWTIATYALLHGGWSHVGLNCLWLVAFGGAVAKRLTTARFLGFMLVCVIAGAGVHYLFHAADLEPVIGASAAVSGAMGAATRFMFQASVRDVARRDGGAGAALPRALTLKQVLTDRRSLAFIAVWFVSNLVFGVSGAVPGLGDATIAWEAHVGGFLAGLLLFGWFDQAGAAYVSPLADQPAASAPPYDQP